jgi:hypothetical protein
MDMQLHIFGPLVKWIIVTDLFIVAFYAIEFVAMVPFIGLSTSLDNLSRHFFELFFLNTIIAMPAAFWLLRIRKAT